MIELLAGYLVLCTFAVGIYRFDSAASNKKTTIWKQVKIFFLWPKYLKKI